MSEQKSKLKVATRSTNSTTTGTTSSQVTHSTQRIVENFLLVWLDANLDQSKQDCQPVLAQVHDILNHIKIFNHTDQAIQYLKTIQKEKVFIIASGNLGKELVPTVHTLSQIDSIYIACGNKSKHEQWTKEWSKIKGLHTNIKPICEALQLAVKQCNHNSVAPSVISSNEINSNTDLSQLESSFMHSQIMKEILSDMEGEDEQVAQNLASYCRQFYSNNSKELSLIDDFEQNYRSKSSIWWYTRECFLYHMLHRAVRYVEVDTLIQMGYFMHNLHKQIEQLHRKQITSYRGKLLVVYRGQRLLKDDYDKVRKSKDGVVSFMNFLSASKDREVALEFTRDSVGKGDTVGILFKITIDPSNATTPFASVREVHYDKTTREEILFSLHSVFRIGEVTKLEDNSGIYEVDLKLIGDTDEQLSSLTERIRNEVGSGVGWRRFGNLLLKIRQLEKAEELYEALFEQASDAGEKAAYYNQLGYIKSNQGNYKKAIDYYEKGLAIKEKTLPADDPSLATSYNNIGAVYNKLGDYSKALSFYGKGLQIKQKTLPPEHPSFATSYNNIGEVCRNMGEYSKALTCYGKLFEIQRATLPSNHPSLATCYNNIGWVYKSMREYSKALTFYEKALSIRQEALPSNHPDLATSYNNIASAYDHMEEYAKALSFYEKTLEIYEKTLSPNHPDLATCYNNIGLVYDKMKEYSKALLYYECALDIQQDSLPPDHPKIQDMRESIEIVKKKL